MVRLAMASTASCASKLRQNCWQRGSRLGSRLFGGVTLSLMRGGQVNFQVDPSCLGGGAASPFMAHFGGHAAGGNEYVGDCDNLVGTEKGTLESSAKTMASSI
jgi:hypothetical protein